MIYIAEKLMYQHGYQLTIPHKLKNTLDWDASDNYVFAAKEPSTIFMTNCKTINDARAAMLKYQQGYKYVLTVARKFQTRIQIIIPSSFIKRVSWTSPRYVTLELTAPSTLTIKELIPNDTARTQL